MEKTGRLGDMGSEGLMGMAGDAGVSADVFFNFRTRAERALIKTSRVFNVVRLRAGDDVPERLVRAEKFLDDAAVQYGRGVNSGNLREFVQAVRFCRKARILIHSA